MTKNMDDKPYMFMEGEDVADWSSVDPINQEAIHEWLDEMAEVSGLGYYNKDGIWVWLEEE